MSWWQENQNDAFTKLRKKIGVLSRAYFKIEAINKKFNLIKDGDLVLDLGAAPGGWTEYLISIKAKVIAVDILDLDRSLLNQVEFIKEDIRNIHLNESVSVIISDIAPNLTGNKIIDMANMESIYESILNLLKYLHINGHLIMKTFMSNMPILLEFKKLFSKTVYFKPSASKSKSSEIYMICIKKVNS